VVFGICGFLQIPFVDLWIFLGGNMVILYRKLSLLIMDQKTADKVVERTEGRTQRKLIYKVGLAEGKGFSTVDYPPK
jgi:hypothetical protein